MAETYLTPGFQAGFSNNPQTGAPSADAPPGGEQYQTPGFKKSFGGQQTNGDGGQQTTQPPAPSSPPYGVGKYLPQFMTQDLTQYLPQSVQDYGSIASNEAMAYGIPSLRAQADAARKRLDPATAATADFVGATLSPTQLLNAVPYVGPEVAGAAHEGIKSAVTNWKPDESWGDYAKNVGEDTAFGAATGGVGRVVAGQAPEHLGDATRELVRGVPAGLLGLHMFHAGADMAENLKTAAETFGLYGGMKKLGNWAGTKVEDLGSSPAVQQAIKSLILGGGSAARQQVPGPLDQLFMGP